MKEYISPEMEIVEFENEDIITGSTCDPQIWCTENTCGLDGCDDDF